MLQPITAFTGNCFTALLFGADFHDFSVRAYDFHFKFTERLDKLVQVFWLHIAHVKVYALLPQGIGYLVSGLRW